MTSTVPSPALARPTARRAAAVAGAVVAPVLIWVVATLLGVDIAVYQGTPTPVPVGLVAVAGASLLVSLVGWGLLALLERRVARAARWWTVVALVVLVLSLAAPLTSGVDLTVGIVLALMHVAVAAVLVPVLRLTSTRR